ncbi:DUF2768 domain-containing protein [Scopulibacillus cellulosilyticus]|uniref:DUF2768 domain-containing protein n=1 Tax=Scopulibacillus cellulosilyticus TaxID=2665665 RepID=A0ABW2PSR2_9BACL
MSPGLIQMWISFIAMGLMIIAALLIMLSRFKLKGIFRFTLSFISYFIFIIGGFLMLLVVIT